MHCKYPRRVARMARKYGISAIAMGQGRYNIRCAPGIDLSVLLALIVLL